MDNQKLRVTITLSPHNDDPYMRRVATADLSSEIRRLAADHPGLIEDAPEGPNEVRRSAEVGTIVIDVLPSIISGLATVIAAYMARQRSVTVGADAKTANGQTVYHGPADEISETITTTQHDPRTPTEAEVQSPSNDMEL
jgi:hypothetical protein